MIQSFFALPTDYVNTPRKLRKELFGTFYNYRFFAGWTSEKNEIKSEDDGEVESRINGDLFGKVKSGYLISFNYCVKTNGFKASTHCTVNLIGSAFTN